MDAATGAIDPTSVLRLTCKSLPDALNFVAAGELWNLVDEAGEEVENLPEVVKDPLPVETPAEVGQRLAEAAMPPGYRVSKRKLEATIRRKIAAHVLLPRATSSMKVKFKLDLAPLQGVQKMCEEAGLVLKEGPKKMGSATYRKWQADGAAATSRFCQVNQAHPRGWGGAKLMGAGKAAT
jgi:hypothetical protein